MPSIDKPFIYTRKDYLKGTIDHHTYYRNLVKPALVEFVKAAFGIKWLTDTRNDGSFNHIPLRKWDAISCNPHMPSKWDWELVEDYPTRAGLVCVLKAAARVAVEQEQNNEV